jgi:signal transduction histidine kinase
MRACRRALDGEPASYEIEYRGRYFVTVCTPLFDEVRNVIGTAGLSVDITERKVAELERDRLLAEERQARCAAEEALRVRDDFIAVASHELNTPLASLLLSVQRLEQCSDDGLMPQFLHLITRQTQRLVQLVTSLLESARAEAGAALDLETVELSTLAGEVARRFEEDFQRAGCAFELRACSTIVGKWDRSRLDLVISNLLSNAIKFGGNKPIVMAVDLADGHARLVVTDHGVGVDQAVRERIFGRFERGVSSRQYGGLGLGLYICSKVVEAHGGRIEVGGAAGKGAIFTVMLPISR